MTERAAFWAVVIATVAVALLLSATFDGGLTIP